MKESNVTKTHEKSQEAENKNAETFNVFIARESSQFERVVMKTVVFNNEEMSANVKRVIHRANSVSRRDRERERDRESRESRENQVRDRQRTTRNEKMIKNDDEMKNVFNTK